MYVKNIIHVLSFEFSDRTTEPGIEVKVVFMINSDDSNRKVGNRAIWILQRKIWK